MSDVSRKHGPRSGRELRWPELVSTRVERGTVARIRSALHQDEAGAAAFVRMAIDAELQRREQENQRALALANVAGWIG
jgi:hypothetical protein